MDEQVGFLISSVEKSLKNLQNKKDFLVEQQLQYNNIHDRLITFKSNREDDDGLLSLENEGEGKDGVRGLVLGDVIISSNKCFLNLGYEYYVEKDFDEVLDFVDEKLSLMKEAIGQFDSKINEAKTTLQNLKDVSKNINQGDESTLDDLEGFDTEFPTMEIREELDDDGNVINSSIRPTNSTKGQMNSNKIEEIKEGNEEKQENEFESNLRVQQMDQQDDLEDGEIDENDIQYDYDKMDGYMEKLNIDEDNEEEEYDEDDYMFHGHMTMVPGSSGQSSFMEQIAKLRAQRNHVDEDKSNNETHLDKKRNVKPLEKSADKKTQIKSILKIGSDVNRDKDSMENGDDDAKKKKKKTKKSVGFAAQLDIHEIENFKEETRKQTHHIFPSMQQLMVSNLVGVKDEDMVDDTNNPHVNEFDNDLFANMLGVKGSEEIHDKYLNLVEKDNVSNNSNNISQEKVARKPKRISRFKKDALERKSNQSKSNNHYENSKNNDDTFISTDIVERNVIEETSNGPDKIVENVIVERQVIDNNIASDVIERDIIAKDINDEYSSSFHNTAVEKNVIKDDYVDNITDITVIENKIIDSDISNNEDTNQFENYSETTKASKENKVKSSLFGKKFNSLQRPHTKPRAKQSLITPEMLEAYEDLDISSNNAKQESKIVELTGNENNEIHNKNGEITKENSIHEEEEEEKPREVFPDEIKTVISQMGKTEDDIHVANVDYSALNNNLDDMVKAYTLGLYDDDLEEHPGTVLEKVEDFTNYNRQVESLKDVIKEFQKNNPIRPPVDAESKDDNDLDDSKIMADEIRERDIPEDYSEIEKNSANIIDDDYGLNVDNLQYAVNLEYHKLKETLLPKLQKESRQFFGEQNVHTHSNDSTSEMELEPIDADGNPIKVSRFKSQRMKLNV